MSEHCTCGDDQLILLGRIEAKTEANGIAIKAINDVLGPLATNCALCKAEGRSAGRKWGAIAGALLITAAEVIRRTFP
jgi:hypothetical protein